MPERVAAVRRAMALYVDGNGGKRILQVLDAEGLRLYGSSDLNNTQQVYRLVKMPQLAGTKPVTVDGEQYLQEGY